MHDTVEWLLKNVPGNNGKVGIWGISYPGFYTSASVIDSHPAIKAASPQAPVTDLYMGDDSYHGGAFMLAANFDFYSQFTKQANPTASPKKWDEFEYGTEDGYQYFLAQMSLGNITSKLTEKQRELLMPTIMHTSYDDFWKEKNITVHLKNIRAAVLTVGGWYDAEDPQGPLSTYQSIKKNNPGIYNGLVMGPWAHGGWGRSDGEKLGYVNFDAKTGDHFRKQIIFPFFEKYLKTAKSDAKPMPEVQAFETGTNIWRNYSVWPPKEAQSRTLYFAEKSSLSWVTPSATSLLESGPYDEYISDPQKPVPYIAYPATGVPKEYMVSDQRFAATRPDVLVYQSAVLEDDITIVGPVVPNLFVSTSGTDADWIVKLIDVYPDEYPNRNPGTAGDAEKGRDVPPPVLAMAGYQQLIRGEPLRGKFRNGFEIPQAFVPGKIERISYAMPDINHTFRRGHRIMVQVQSSWFPLIDLNPQKFMDIPQARPEDFQKAIQRIYRAPGQFSGIIVQVLSK
jgi:putative CocE/NonD family hydrolase